MEIVCVCLSEKSISFKFKKFQIKFEYKFFLNGESHQVYIIDDFTNFFTYFVYISLRFLP